MGSITTKLQVTYMFQERNHHVSQKLSLNENFYMLSRTITYILNDAVIMLYSKIYRTTKVVRNHYKCSTTVVSKLEFLFYTITLSNLVAPTCSVWLVILFQEMGAVHPIKYSFSNFLLHVIYLLNLFLI